MIFKERAGFGLENRPEAILFDLDGTLVDSYEALTSSVNHVRHVHGLAALTQEEVRRAVGSGVFRLMERTVPGSDPIENARLFTEHHPSVLLSGTTILPDVLETLALLRECGYRLGVCSNKPLALVQQLLELLKIDHCFDAVLGPESVGKPKPAPDMLIAAMQQLHTTKENTLYVGDMVIDIETARSAGVTVWAVPTGSDSVEALQTGKPDRLLTRFGEMSCLVD